DQRDRDDRATHPDQAERQQLVLDAMRDRVPGGVRDRGEENGEGDGCVHLTKATFRRTELEPSGLLSRQVYYGAARSSPGRPHCHEPVETDGQRNPRRNHTLRLMVRDGPKDALT